MMTIRRRWQTAVGFWVILLLATACLQTTGDQASGPQISMILTETETPTPTEEPSLTPTEEPEETEEEAVDLPIAENPTETPSPTNTATETPTETEVPATEVAQLGDGGLGQLLETPEEEIDSFSLTATMIVASATAQGLVPTWTADALTAQANQSTIFTPTPTLDTGFGDLFTATSSAPVLSGADCVHEVRAGDTLFRMSINYGIPVMDIATRNGITNPDLISIGQMLVINGCGTTGVFPPATSFPTESAAIGGPDLSGQVGQGGGGACTTQYTVQQYDNLFQISLRYGVPVQSIANANGIGNINIIDMGSVLCIPAS